MYEQKQTVSLTLFVVDKTAITPAPIKVFTAEVHPSQIALGRVSGKVLIKAVIKPKGLGDWGKHPTSTLRTIIDFDGWTVEGYTSRKQAKKANVGRKLAS